MAMQKHEGQSDFGRVESSSRLIELPGSLYLEHQVSSVYVLHHKKQSILLINQCLVRLIQVQIDKELTIIMVL